MVGLVKKLLPAHWRAAIRRAAGPLPSAAATSYQQMLDDAGRGPDWTADSLLLQIREIGRLLRLDPRADLLDLGCGNGWLDVALSGFVRSVVGVEPSAALVAKAGERLKLFENITVFQGSATNLSLKNGAVDRLLAIETLQCIAPDALPAAVLEMHRVCRLGSLLLFASVPNPGEPTPPKTVEWHGETLTSYTHDLRAFQALWERLGASVSIQPVAAGHPRAEQGRVDILVRLAVR